MIYFVVMYVNTNLCYLSMRFTSISVDTVSLIMSFLILFRSIKFWIQSHSFPNPEKWGTQLYIWNVYQLPNCRLLDSLKVSNYSVVAVEGLLKIMLQTDYRLILVRSNERNYLFFKSFIRSIVRFIWRKVCEGYQCSVFSYRDYH